MCNAWNHDVGCRCGWGGDGYSGSPPGGWQYSPGRGRPSRLPAIFFVAESYRADGAVLVDVQEEGFGRPSRCPSCGRDAYFIRHNGGAAWFDTLAWPWPIHQCPVRDTSKWVPPGIDEIAEMLVTEVPKDGILTIILRGDESAGVEGRYFGLLCADGTARRALLESHFSPGALVGRLGFLVPKSMRISLIRPRQHFRATRLFTTQAVQSHAELGDVLGLAPAAPQRGS